ncbi:MAG TPA: hypothetical protein VGL88_05275 [Pseudonocardiaceae bacterium]|jgi:hypothetical protein
MSAQVRWAVSIRDWHNHAIEDHGNHPSGVYIAQCGQRLMSNTTLRDAPVGRFVCQICADAQLTEAQAGSLLHEAMGSE